MRLSVNVKIISHSVGQGLAPVRKKLHIKSNRRTTARVVPTVANFFKFDETQAPSSEGA